MGDLSRHFSRRGFHCTGCRGRPCPNGHNAGTGFAVVDGALLDLLEHLRAHFGASIKVNSGFRCEQRNRAVGGATRSKHLHGMAADIVISGVSPDDVYAYLDKGYNGGRGWQGGLGRYRTFTHIDTRAYEQRF